MSTVNELTIENVVYDIEDTAARNMITVVNNTVVPTTAWVSDNTYSDFPKRAAIAITGCTTSHYPEVIFNAVEASSGLYAPVCATYTGGVYIYASSTPTASITIPTIKLFKQA